MGALQLFGQRCVFRVLCARAWSGWADGSAGQRGSTRAAKCRDYLKKENVVDLMVLTSSRFEDDALIQRMSSEAVVNLSQLGAEDSDDPKKVPNPGLAEVVVRCAKVGRRGNGSTCCSL